MSLIFLLLLGLRAVISCHKWLARHYSYLSRLVLGIDSNKHNGMVSFLSFIASRVPERFNLYWLLSLLLYIVFL
jgi:hypothetical protein